MKRAPLSQKYRIARALSAAHGSVLFFVVVAFPVTCCMMLFVTYLQRSMGLVLTEENVRFAAIITFCNVLLLTVLFAACDKIRRVRTVERPLQQIISAAERIMQGDFSVRIPIEHSIYCHWSLTEAAQCFNRMAQELSSIETLKSDFISNVSHELKTPLAAISNYAFLLQMPDLPQQEREKYTRAISDTARRLADLIFNILKLNKLENQQIYPQAQSLNLGAQLAECLLNFEEAIDSKQLELEAELEESAEVLSDAELLAIVWNNLLSNAVKFTPPGGRITVTLRTEGEYALVQVKDTGCGIRSEVGARIFDKFYQGDTSHAAEGNGLGLALVKRVIDIIGGDITVSSRVGEGSTFCVRLRRTHPDSLL